MTIGLTKSPGLDSSEKRRLLRLSVGLQKRNQKFLEVPSIDAGKSDSPDVSDVSFLDLKYSQISEVMFGHAICSKTNRNIGANIANCQVCHQFVF